MLVPILNPFDSQNTTSVVIMDNASIYHIDSVVSMINATGALIRFLPSYSPDMNPTENAFGEVKHYLQANSILFDTSLSTHTILLMAFNSSLLTTVKHTLITLDIMVCHLFQNYALAMVIISTWFDCKPSQS